MMSDELRIKNEKLKMKNGGENSFRGVSKIIVNIEFKG